MPWNECKPMDERLKFIARLLDGEKMPPYAASSAFHASPVTRYSTVTRNVVWMLSMTALTDLTLLTQCSDGQPLPVTNVTLPLDEDGREALEGMRIHIDGELTVTDVYRLNQGNFTLAANGFQYTPTELMPPGPEAARQSGQNREHSLPVMLPKDLQLDGVLAAGNSIRAATGVLAHDRRGLRLALQAFSASSSSGFDLPHAAQAGSLRVVGMNLYNYFNGDGRGSGFPAPRGAETVEAFHQQRERIRKAVTPDFFVK